jgi:hypothetical protein
VVVLEVHLMQPLVRLAVTLYSHLLPQLAAAVAVLEIQDQVLMVVQAAGQEHLVIIPTQVVQEYLDKEIMVVLLHQMVQLMTVLVEELVQVQ